jgi:hypothetical protein
MSLLVLDLHDVTRSNRAVVDPQNKHTSDAFLQTRISNNPHIGDVDWENVSPTRVVGDALCQSASPMRGSLEFQCPLHNGFLL